MSHRVCPWWMGYLLASPLRRWRQDPSKILPPYVGAGMTVLEPGPGMGFFTLELARLAGPAGRVVAVDIQARMLASLKRRLRRAGLEERVDMRLASKESLGLGDLAGGVDFALAFYMVHEAPAADRFFAEVAATLKPGGCVLLAEPAGHVKPIDFENELRMAAQAGLEAVERPVIRRSIAAVLRKRA